MIDRISFRSLSAGVCILAVLSFFAAPRTHAQDKASQAPATPPPVSVEAPLLAYDVVSIKPHKDEAGMIMMGTGGLTPNGFSASGVTMDALLRNAFGVTADRVLNLPEWAKSTRFDMQAKVAPEDMPRFKALSGKQRWAMLLPALEDRFGLKFHHETKKLTVYALVVAKGGLKMKRSADSGTDQLTNINMSPQGMILKGSSSDTGFLASMLSQQIESIVVDKTGLSDKYDYTLSFTPESGGSLEMGMKLPPGIKMGAPGSESETPFPSPFTAVQEQLGLKLEAHKEPVDVIVVDHVSQPSPN